MKDDAAVLIVPACEKSRGGGHLRRSLYLLRALEEGGQECFLWISEHQKEEVFFRFQKFFENSNFSRGFHARLLSNVKELTKRTWDFIILDRFGTPKKEFAFWASLGPIVGIDEGGPNRKSFDFLIDILPALKGHNANLSKPALLPLPKNRRPVSGRSPVKKKENQPYNVLISFGAEDSNKLGLSLVKLLVSTSSFLLPHSSLNITYISPDPGQDFPELEHTYKNLRVMGLIPDLKEHLVEYDLFITHFGIGAFEAVYARVPVLLVSPTTYHEKLAKNAGFFSLGIGREIFHAKPHRTFGSRRKGIFDTGFYMELEKRRESIARRFGLEEEQVEDLGTFFSALTPIIPKACPACGKKAMEGNPVLARFPEETYRRCRYCNIIYLSRLKAPPITYDEEYFFEFYKKQYGKTYLEDFPNLITMAHRRLSHIKGILKLKAEAEPRPSILDIGCAYGPFMAAAAEAGFMPYGLDPVEEAVRYVNEELGLFAWQGFFPTGAKAEDGPFDAVTLWYVIEHFENPGKVLKEVHRILREGGVLAFSTPSYSGVSGRRSLQSFLKNSPGDHFTVWNPRCCRKVLKKYGFRLRKIIVTGHNPKRFPIFGRFVKSNEKNLLYRLLFFISKIFRLGDTFEVYSTKD